MCNAYGALLSRPIARNSFCSSIFEITADPARIMGHLPVRMSQGEYYHFSPPRSLPGNYKPCHQNLLSQTNCYNASTYSEYLVRQSRPVQVDGAAGPDFLAEPRLQPRAPTDLQPRIVGLLASVNGR